MSSDGGGERITNKMLDYRIGQIEKKIDSIEHKLDLFLDAQHKQENQIIDHEARIKTDHCEIEKLRSTSRTWDIATGIGAAVAAILGALGIRQ